MVPFIKSLRFLAYAFFYDANKFRRWMRMLLCAISLSGSSWADQAEAFTPHKVVLVFRGICWFVAIIVAVHGDPVQTPETST